MAPQVERMAFRKSYGYPWHRLGTPLTEKMTATDAALAINMDYEIRKVALYADMDGILLPSPSADLYSNHDGEWKYLNTIKRADGYEIVQNMDIAGLLDEGGDQALSAVFDVDTLGILSSGKRTFFALRLGEETVKIGVDGDDHYIAHLLIYNDFTGNGTLQVAMGITRPVCLNTIKILLNESEKGGALWTFPHRSQPLAQLKFRVELERTVQEARRSFYKELEQWATVPMKWEQMNAFVEAVYPNPPEPKKVKRAAYITEDMNPEVTAPIQVMADDARKVWQAGLQRAEDNRNGLTERIQEYVGNSMSGPTLYWAFNAGTDWMCWSKERGDWNDVAESIMYNNRGKDMERLLTATRKVANPNYKQSKKRSANLN